MKKKKPNVFDEYIVIYIAKNVVDSLQVPHVLRCSGKLFGIVVWSCLDEMIITLRYFIELYCISLAICKPKNLTLDC